MASDSSKVWTAFSLVAALLAAAAARKALNTGWKAATGKPPQNPADPDVDIGEAVAWAVLSAAASRSGWRGCSRSARRRRTT